MARVQLVAESFEEFNSKIDPISLDENLDEGIGKDIVDFFKGSRGALKSFMKDAEKNENLFCTIYAKQCSDPKVKQKLESLDLDTKKKLASQSWEKVKADPKLGMPWLNIQNGKIVGAGAMKVGKSKTGSDLGQ